MMWKFSRAAYERMADGRYRAIGDLNGRLVIVIREEHELPPEPTAQILVSVELKADGSEGAMRARDG